MKRILLSIFILNTLLYSNKVYNISKDDYNKYKNNPAKMISIFKNKFLKKVKKVVLKKPKKSEDKLAKDIKNTIIIKETVLKKLILDKNTSKVSQKVTKIKSEKYYTYDEVNNKLYYNNIMTQSDINILLRSVNKILEPSKNKYNIDEILLILKRIHNKKISKFESKIYLKQIKKLLRDEI